MKAKINYYTPKENEFRVDFEYEYRTLSFDDIWSEWVEGYKIRNLINLGTINRLLNGDFNSNEDFKKFEVRCKLINSDDIKDLGFIFSREYSNNWQEIFLREDSSKYYNNGITLDEDGIRIYRDINDYETCVFDGILKNKLELKDILKKVRLLK